MARILIHAHGACKHAAAHVRDATNLERALNGAILTALAMEDRKGHVNLKLTELTVNKLEETAASIGCAAGNQHYGSTIVLLPGTRHHIGNLARIVKPGAVAIDADQHRVEALRIERRDNVIGGFKGDIVLGGDTAEQDGDVGHGDCPLSQQHPRARLFTRPYYRHRRQRWRIVS